MTGPIQNRRGHGPAGPADEILFVIVVLVVVFGYSPMEALGLTGRITYWTFVLVAAPIALLFLVYLAYDAEPIGGGHDRWWAPYAHQVHDRVGIERLERVSLTEGFGEDEDEHGQAHGHSRGGGGHRREGRHVHGGHRH